MSNENESIELESLLELPVSPLNPPKEFSPEVVEGMRESLREEGQLEPIILHKDVRGKITRLTGNLRVAAWEKAREAGEIVPPIVVSYFEGSPDKARYAILASDLVRQHRSATERAYACLRLRRLPKVGRKRTGEKGLSIRELARFAQVGKATLERLISIEKESPDKLEAVVRGELKLTEVLRDGSKRKKENNPSPSPSPPPDPPPSKGNIPPNCRVISLICRKPEKIPEKAIARPIFAYILKVIQDSPAWINEDTKDLVSLIAGLLIK